jgi:hypothetical protein
MYYVNLGAAAHSNIFGGTQIDNLALFTNLAQFPSTFNPTAYEYWTSTLDPSYPGDQSGASAWYFDVGDGWTGFGAAGSYMHAWAVHDGDVGQSITEPGSLWLLAIALASGAGICRRFKARLSPSPVSIIASRTAQQNARIAHRQLRERTSGLHLRPG